MQQILAGGQSLATNNDQVIDRIEQHLWPKGLGRDVWMIADAAQDSRIYGMLQEFFHSRLTCLFRGDIPREIQAVAPYLVQLDYKSQQTRRLIAHAWGNNWGIFLKCDEESVALARHLRRFLIVRDEHNDSLLFRYYDPRILRVYLPTCTADELRTVFGPIERYIVEDNASAALLEFYFADKLQKNRMQVG